IADREVLDGALCLGAPEGIGGDPHLAQRISFDPERLSQDVLHTGRLDHSSWNSPILLPRRYGRPDLDPTRERARRGIEEIDHEPGDILGEYLPLRAGVGGPSAELGSHAAGHDGADPDAIVTYLLHERLGESHEA